MKKFTYLIVLLFTFNIAYGQVQIDTAINFSVKDIHGETIELFPILDAGNFVVIDFFSTSCGPCALYAPDIEASYKDFGENEGNVFFLSICWGDDNAGVAYFDSVYNVTHPSVSGSQGGGNLVHNKYRVVSTPSVILISPDRLILEHYIWEPTQSNLNSVITAAGGILVGIDDEISEKINSLLIYPNPTTDIFNVKLEVAESAAYQIEVFNLLGALVHQSIQQHYAPGSHILTANLNRLPGGTYFVRLIRNGQHENLSKIILLD